MTRAAKSMLNIGLDPYHGVGIIGFNSPEWIISFMASIMVRFGCYKQLGIALNHTTKKAYNFM